MSGQINTASDAVIVWFRQDLRIADNPALAAAANTGHPVLPVFVLDEDARLGGAALWWLHHSLKALSTSLRDLGSSLILRRGSSGETIRKLVEQTHASAVYWSRAYDRLGVRNDKDISEWLRQRGIEAKAFRSTLLFEPEEVKTKQGGFYQNFTPFWRACLEAPPPGTPKPAPKSLTPLESLPKSDSLESWKLLPTTPDWTGGLRESWKPGEASARDQLHDFLDDRLDDYAGARDQPGITGTSRLSPHLNWGEISPRQIWHATLHAQAGKLGSGQKSADRFMTELGWREFSYGQLYRHPDLDTEPLRPAFRNFPWENSAELLDAWQRGRTGYPLVDAGMRELWHTGWMHNRVRLIVASFLVKHLLQPWQEGEKWFWDCLVDADSANNAANWQWVAGCGADAAPYFRIFNPILQGKKFDPNGIYVRRWIPEIAGRDDHVIHEPIEASAGPRFIRGRGATIGPEGSYPPPIVNHDWARKRALAALSDISGEGRARDD